VASVDGDGVSKLDQIKALGDAKRAARKSSDGGVESRPTIASGSGPLPTAHSDGDACSALEPPKRAAKTVGRHQESKRTAGVAPGPSEAKPKRGRPRIGEVREKPWIAAGMSERTWYRQKEKGEKQ
jgi:hypothetical protein